MTVHTRQFVRSARSVSRARDFVAARVGDAVPADRADDIRLCVSELTTNALLHGTPRGRRFRVHVTVDDDGVRIEVHDASDAPPHLRDTADTDDYGRGLQLVDVLADEWGTSDRTGPGKAVWASFKATAPALSRSFTTTAEVLCIR
ncbi:ATP-binding protein [Streptomyces sp. MAR4 CNY-716]